VHHRRNANINHVCSTLMHAQTQLYSQRHLVSADGIPTTNQRKCTSTPRKCHRTVFNNAYRHASRHGVARRQWQVSRQLAVSRDILLSTARVQPSTLAKGAMLDEQHQQHGSHVAAL
jgi:hypothetical protein